MTELILLDANTREFTANGTKYFVASGLSLERLALKEQFDIEFAFGASFKELLNVLKESYLLLNDRRFADGAVALHKGMQGIANLEKKEIPAAKLCTLFINMEGEDLTSYSEDLAARKLEDWNRGGIDPRFFFQLAALSIPGFIPAYKDLIQDTLKTNLDLAAD